MTRRLSRAAWEAILFTLTIMRVASLMFAAAALLVSVILGGLDRLFDPEWLWISIFSAFGYVLSSGLFFVMAEADK